MGKHAKLAPSGASRWMPCPGSIALCAKVPTPPTSDYAKEGTAAHKLAADSFVPNGILDPGTLIGNTIAAEGKKFTVDEDMVEAVQVYLDAVRGDLKGCSKEYTLGVEKPFNLSWLCKDMFGTVDLVIYDPQTKRLTVYDYKHGQGTRVDVEWNPQLLIYALGALYEAWDVDEMLPVTAFVEIVEIVIVQPRMEHEDGYVRRWEISTADLLYWGLQVLKPSALRTEAPDAKLLAGDHCKFCDAGAVCPEKAKQACVLAKTDFDKPIFPSPEQMTPEMILDVLGKVGMFSKWADQVKAFAFAQMQSGKVYPGHKIVRSSKHRIWVDGGEGVAKVLGEDAYKERKVISPAQAEKILKKQKKSPDAELEGLWEKPEGDLIMVPDTDRRAEITSPAAQAFLADDAMFN